MARKHLIAVVSSFTLGALVAPYAAQAAMAVIDGTAIGKAIEQLNELKKQYATEIEQLGQLKEHSTFLTGIVKSTSDTSDSIGKVGKIKVPTINLEKIAAQTKGNFRCLLPKTEKWGIKTEDINLGSICDTASKYRAALFADPDDMKGQTFATRDAKRVEVANNRTALLEDTTSRSLAQADVQIKQADELNSAADSLQTDLDNTETAQDRAHVEAQVSVARLRAEAQQAQTLAQMLKLQAAMAAMAGLPPDKIAEITKGEGK
jgi:hypothetical protein